MPKGGVCIVALLINQLGTTSKEIGQFCRYERNQMTTQDNK